VPLDLTLVDVEHVVATRTTESLLQRPEGARASSAA
jgi:hypothetical protein